MLEGWLNGVSALGVLVSLLIIGFYALIKSLKLKATLLRYTGITIIFIGLLWLGPTTDFIKILITGTNINPVWIYPLLSYMWAAPGIFFGMYIGGELLIPKRKWYLLTIIIIAAIAYEFFLFANPINSFDFTIPGLGEVTTPGPGDVGDGSNIIDTSSEYGYPTAFFLIAFILIIILINGIGFLKKALEATGVLRTKFLYLAFGFIVFAIIVTFDSLIPPGIFLSVVRFGIIASGILLYLGIRS